MSHFDYDDGYDSEQVEIRDCPDCGSKGTLEVREGDHHYCTACGLESYPSTPRRTR